MQPKSTVILCGGKALNKAGIDSDKKIKDADLAKLVASDLWKKEKEDKKKK